MRCLCKLHHCHQLRQLQRISSGRCGGSIYLQIRPFANRSSPSFGSSNPSPHGQHPYRKRNNDFSENKANAGETHHDEKTSSKRTFRAKVFTKFPLSLRQTILVGLLGCASYGVYVFHTDPHRSVLLQPKFFAPFMLDIREKISSTSSILHLRSVPPGQNTENVDEAWRIGVWSVQVMQPELQIARSYTPLPPEDKAEPEQLRLFVRKEPNGEVSSFLHRISRGTLVHLRGPHIEYTIPENVDEVLFLAGGTGIAPALQVAHVLLNHGTSSATAVTKLRILWANRRREDSHLTLRQPVVQHSVVRPAQTGVLSKIRSFTTSVEAQSIDGVETETREPTVPASIPQTPLVEEVEALKSKYPGRVEVEYFVDEDKSYINESVLRHYLSGHNKTLESSLNIDSASSNKKLLLLSGPEGFINFYAGPKLLKAGRETQGPLGGLLQKIHPQGWDIWKL